MAFTSITPAFAQINLGSKEANSPKVVMMDASEIDMSVPDELVGMDQFLSLDSQGCIQLDASAALAAGYAEQSISFVQGNLERINEQVLAGDMYVDDTFTAHTGSEISLFKIEWTSTGYTGSDSTWYGALYIYYNADQAYYLYKAFNSTYTNCMMLLDNLNQMSSDPEAKTAYSLTVTAALVVGYSALVYRNSVSSAMSKGTGIVWLVTQEPSSGTIGWAFDAQDWSQITPKD